jgi:integrase
MVAAMLFGGLRRCEVLGLQLSDIQVADRRVFIAEGKGLPTEKSGQPTALRHNVRRAVVCGSICASAEKLGPSAGRRILRATR